MKARQLLLLLFAVFIVAALAQQNNPPANNNDNDNTPAPGGNTNNNNRPPPAADADTPAAADDNPPAADADENPPANTPAADDEPADKPAEKPASDKPATTKPADPKPTIPQGTPAGDEGRPPALDTPSPTTNTPTQTRIPSGTPADDSDVPLPGLDEIQGWRTPVIKAPSAAGNPYLQHSSAPEGTVFIAVGSALAFIGLLILLWRALVAYSLHRSVRRVAARQSTIYDKPKASPAAFYGAGGPGSSLSLGEMGARGGTPNASALFFSPTQNAANGGLFNSPTAMTMGGNRHSGYLPAGYYAAGNGGHRGSVGGVPGSRGTVGSVAGAGWRGNDSSSSLGVRETGGRAPSAYLEDLFESRGGEAGRRGY